MSRKKKNIEVMEYLDYVVSYVEKKDSFKFEHMKFKKLRETVFLEKYFEDEMRAANVDISDILFDYFDFDLYNVTDESVRKMYNYLSNPDEETRNRMLLVFVRVKELQTILKEYHS